MCLQILPETFLIKCFVFLIQEFIYNLLKVEPLQEDPAKEGQRPQPRPQLLPLRPPRAGIGVQLPPLRQPQGVVGHGKMCIFYDSIRKGGKRLNHQGNNMSRIITSKTYICLNPSPRKVMGPSKKVIVMGSLRIKNHIYNI